MTGRSSLNYIQSFSGFFQLKMKLLQEGGPLPGHGSELLSNTLKWSKETHVLTKQETLLGRGARAESSRWGDPGGLLCHVALSLRFHGDGVSFRVVFSQSSWLRVLPAGACITQPRWMPERIQGGGQTCGVSFWPFLNSSAWWWLISSVFLTRTSRHKITHANGGSGAWPGWTGSVSVLPLTTPPWETAYSRYFLGTGVEVSFFCNFFLLCMSIDLPSRAEVSLNLSQGVLCLKPAFILVGTAI